MRRPPAVPASIITLALKIARLKERFADFAKLAHFFKLDNQLTKEAANPSSVCEAIHVSAAIWIEKLDTCMRLKTHNFHKQLPIYCRERLERSLERQSNTKKKGTSAVCTAQARE